MLEEAVVYAASLRGSLLPQNASLSQQLGKLCRSLFVRLMALVREKASAGKDNDFAVRQAY